MSQQQSLQHSAGWLSLPRWNFKGLRRYRVFILGITLLLFGAAIVMALVVWLNQTDGRTANETLRLSWSPPSETAWTTENAFPRLKFFEPTCIAFANDESGRAFVFERRGTVQMFKNDANTSEYVQVLDISSQVWRTPYEDDGAVAIALHSEFGQEGSPSKGYFYLLFTAKINNRRYNRLTRFTLVGERARDEFVLIDQANEDLWHNGGGLTFGPDGFLYVGVGDEGTNGDGLENGQRIDKDLFCGVLRIDVDRRGGKISYPPPRQPATGKTAGYYIPADNPFVDVPNALHEFWAHGLRNPYRLAFDEKDGRLWAAEVGHLRREEVNIIRKGANYGWSHREGTLPFTESYLQGVAPTTMIGEEVDPVWEYPHLNGNSCVIGGFVYRGKKHPQLQGKYIYADNGSGRVWALQHDDGQATGNEELLSLPVSSKTGIASVQPDANGEPLIVILGETGAIDGTIRRVIAADKRTASALPSKLSETGIFVDVKSLTPSPGVIPYKINAPQSAGAARIRRWMAVPGDGLDPDPNTDRVRFAAEDAWKFPCGTVFVQHFDLPVADEEGERWRPIETRVLVRHSGDGVYGLAYRWNDAETDATLVQEPNLLTVNVRDSQGSVRPQSWPFLDRQTCLACHNENAGFILGVNTRQLNRPFDNDQSASPYNQLMALSDKEFFHEPPEDAGLASLNSFVAPFNEDFGLDQRARSYLDVNCSACHREGGARSKYLAEFHLTTDPATLAIKPGQGDFGIADAKLIAPGDPHRSVLYYRLAKLGQGRMPFVGAHDLDNDALRLLRQWIEQMKPVAEPSPLHADMTVVQDENLAGLIEGRYQPGNADTDVAVNLLLSETRGAFALWQAIHDGNINEPLRSEIIALGNAHESPAVRDLFEWFIEPQHRTARLGTEFDPILVLQQNGDAERGRELYSNTEIVSCRNCHPMQPEKSSVGPDLIDLGRKFTRRELLRHIMEPSLRIDPKYETWMVETATGHLHQGVLVHRTEDEIVLKDAKGVEHRIDADNIEFMQKVKRSLMPDNLLQSLTPVQAADLLTYLHALQ